MAELIKESGIPLYIKLSNILREQIKNEEFKSGDCLPSENKLSQKYEMSRMTARASLLQLEREGLVCGIPSKGWIVAEEDKQTPSPFQYLSSFTVGIYPFQEQVKRVDFYGTPLLNGLNRGFSHHHITGKFFDREQAENSGLSLSSLLNAEGIDGIIWIDPGENDLPQVMELKQKGVPVVIINQTFPGSQIDCVVCNHYKGSYQLVNYLVKMDHKDIACITISRKLAYALQRWRGYSDALIQHGLSVNPELTIELEIENFENEKKLEKEILGKLDALRKKKNWPTAIFIAGGSLTLPVLTYLDKAKIKVPDNISVVAFDETHLPLRLMKPTCVRQPLERMGERAVSVLVNNLRGKKNRPAEIILEPTFMPGNSCISYSKMFEK